MSPVETLREAARLMRERAEAATQPWGVDRWLAYVQQPSNPTHAKDYDRIYVGTDDEHGSVILSSPWTEAAPAEHAASWHPAVALAVADLLDAEADATDEGFNGSADSHAVAIARAYLGEVSS